MRGPAINPSGVVWGCKNEGIKSDCSERRSLTIFRAPRCLSVGSLRSSPFATLRARERAFFTNDVEVAWEGGAGVLGDAIGDCGGCECEELLVTVASTRY